MEKFMNSSVALRLFAHTTPIIGWLVRMCEVVEQFLWKPFRFFLRIFSISGWIWLNWLTCLDIITLLYKLLLLKFQLQTKVINSQQDIKLGQFTEELDAVFKTIKKSKVSVLDKIPPEIWKTRKFYDMCLWLYNAIYKQNSREID